MTISRELAQTAIELISLHFSVIPTNADKKATISWKEFQSRIMTTSEVQLHFVDGIRLALVGGKVSGNLECLDIDDPATFEPFLELLDMHHPGLHGRLLKRKTPSGGYHLIYRCSAPVAGNLKLACTESGSVRIETRGEGGYFLSAPSPGYEVLSGNLKDCPVLSPEEIVAIHVAAMAFDKREKQCADSPKLAQDSELPGTRFNQTHTIAEILLTHGWAADKPTTAGQGWTRPGKSAGTSGVLLRDTGNFFVWSSNASPLESGRSYDAFGLYAAYNHACDFTAAARTLGRCNLQVERQDDLPLGNQSQEWEPTPPDWPSMNPRAYHGIIADFIELATRTSEADPAAILATFLVRFGVECGPGAFMQVGDTKHRARLASVIVGASSKARKGTSGKPVERLFDFTNVNEQNLIHPARVSMGPFSSGEGIIYAIRDPSSRWNPKTQAEEIVDLGVDDKRLFVLDEEFGGVLANTKREGNTLSMVIRQAWDSGSFDPLTKNNKITATGGHVGWVSHITLQELQAKLDLSEGFNGFANRILWICAKRQKLVADPLIMPQCELECIQRHLIDILFRVGQGCEIKLGPRARSAWCEQYYPELTKDRPGLVGCITNRGEAQALRLAMIYCLLAGQTVITLDHLQSGIAFWEYCFQSVKQIFHGRQTDHRTQIILEALQGAGRLTGRELYALFKNNISKVGLETALSELMASGQLIVEKQKNQKGAPTKVYRFHENLYEFNELNELNAKDDDDDPIKFVNSFNSLPDESTREASVL
ncbi:MAG: bifunctional DNA primase/polymerase [Desulfocapsaceae bacterium]|nr:bifunctional DNA primase/polymerase [Desulfocapsaceae bacterium]